jgi:hypothetical protein
METQQQSYCDSSQAGLYRVHRHEDGREEFEIHASLDGELENLSAAWRGDTRKFSIITGTRHGDITIGDHSHVDRLQELDDLAHVGARFKDSAAGSSDLVCTAAHVYYPVDTRKHHPNEFMRSSGAQRSLIYRNDEPVGWPLFDDFSELDCRHDIDVCSTSTPALTTQETTKTETIAESVMESGDKPLAEDRGEYNDLATGQAATTRSSSVEAPRAEAVTSKGFYGPPAMVITKRRVSAHDFQS